MEKVPAELVQAKAKVPAAALVKALAAAVGRSA
jgi:hypothetical protein